MKMILGKKVGMTQIFTEAGDVVPVTVIEATSGEAGPAQAWTEQERSTWV